MLRFLKLQKTVHIIKLALGFKRLNVSAILQNPVKKLRLLSIQASPDSATNIHERPYEYHSTGDCSVLVHFKCLS